MNKYKNFRVQDFVWDDSFRQWVLHPTRESDRMWSAWLAENEDMLSTANQARDMILAMVVNEPSITDQEIKRNVKTVIGKLTLTPAEERTEKRRINVWLRMAAAVVLISMLGWWGSKMVLRTKPLPGETQVVSSDIPAGAELIEVYNNKPVAQVVSLEDGSKITLRPGGLLKYKKGFSKGERREVYLTGEAFFDVAKNPERPFFVYARELVTKVLGTSFNIDARVDSDNVTVAVRTGKVSVFAASDLEVKEKITSKELDGIILTPNQKITFQRDKVRLVKSIVEQPEIILPKTQVPRFDFEETPVSEVFATIAKAYGIEIIYDEDLFGGCPLTARLDTENLHDKLTIICKAVEANYEILDGQIIIHGKGCKN